MKLGINELKNFFNNKSFKWFDTREVRDEESLSPEDLQYIKGWTISPLGIGNFIYLVTRKLPDLATVYFFIFLYFEIVKAIPVSVAEPVLENEIFALLFLLFGIAIRLIGIYTMFFLFRHGRRLSWNRGRYAWGLSSKAIQFQSVNELKKSENNFIYFNVIPSLILISVLLFISSF